MTSSIFCYCVSYMNMNVFPMNIISFEINQWMKEGFTDKIAFENVTASLITAFAIGPSSFAALCTRSFVVNMQIFMTLNDSYWISWYRKFSNYGQKKNVLRNYIHIESCFRKRKYRNKFWETGTHIFVENPPKVKPVNTN